MIRDGLSVSGGFEARTDVCVIGSGAGGGVAAGLLSEAGREVLVLEEGQHVPRERMTQREEEMQPLLYRDGGAQGTADGAVAVLQGSVVGGSTVVNMADVVDTPSEVLAHWKEHHGLSRYTELHWEAAAQAARRGIHASAILEPELNRNARVLIDGGRKIGLQSGPMEHNRVGCVGSGYCLIGCAYDAKQSVAVTWIPRALATGRCLVQTDARVERLEWSGSRVVAAVGSIVEPLTKRVLASFRVEADHFVLAAGAIHSPLLLLASGLGGPLVGQNLTLQPQVPVAAFFPEEIVHFRGIPQAGFASGETHTAEHGLDGFRLESVSATPGFSASLMMPWGADLADLLTRWRNVAALLCLVPDQPGGRVHLRDDGRPRIEYALQDRWRKNALAGIQAAAAAYFAAGAEAVGLPWAGGGVARSVAELVDLERFAVRPNSIPLISAHPQGTCRMSPDPSRGVVGEDFRPHGVANLQVLDASVFPTSASTHTMIPVMQAAHLGVWELL